MKSVASRVRISFVLLAITAAASGALAREAQQPQPAQAVSESGLLPIYGVDFNFDPAWVDGSKFPSQAAQYPNSGVSNSFQQAWDGLKPSGFNIVRFQLDVRDSATSANRLANLSVWARQNRVKLIPVLLGADRGKFPGKEFPQTAASVINMTLTALRGGDGQSLAAYGQILAYQIEDQVNHAGLHQPFYPQYVAPLIAQVAIQIRQTEQSALKGVEMNATPLMINVSLDFELIVKQAIAGATMTDDAYAQAYDRVKQMLTSIAATPEIDVIDVQWLAGSMSAGSPEKFAPLLTSLASDVPGKQFILTTGFSTAFRSGEDQKSFLALTSVNLAGYRSSAGVDSPFLGVILREALKGKDPNPAPPKPQTPTEMARWNWAAKASEMIDTWSTKKPSADMIWWLRKVEGNLGLLTVQTDSAGNPSFAAGLHELTPSSASLTELRATAPAGLRPGNYWVRVVADGVNSNVWRAYAEAPPVPAPTLDTISPGVQYPGKRVVLTGTRFAADSVVTLEFLERDGVSYTRIGRPAVRLLGPTQLEFQIPQETWPGDYRLAVRNTGSSFSLWRTFKVLAPHYRVAFEQIRCMDESGAEWPGDDEIYTVFTGTTEAVSLGKRTGEISGFSDGVLKRYSASDGAAFRPDGSAEPVKSFLIFSAALFEGDDSEAAEIRDATDWLSGIGGPLAGAIAVLYGATAGIAGAITTIAGLVILGIGELVALLTEGDDALGQQLQSYAATSLQTMTAATGELSNRMYFSNDDDTGSYQITYRVIRSEP